MRMTEIVDIAGLIDHVLCNEANGTISIIFKDNQTIEEAERIKAYLKVICKVLSEAHAAA